ncbi:alpha/beta fold hydrolase [Streptomyces sp. NPDC006510]|uniref:alpha/beta fold hydrolase n=1 Tax=Streptomyces sp. NPDC006510 TaxID=3155600 RepID=UPI0033BF6BF5
MTALYVRHYGAAEGRALLALHGIKGHGARWRRIADTSLRDFSVIAPDLRGHGRCDHAPPWNTEAHVADMLAVLDARHLDRVDLHGGGTRCGPHAVSRTPRGDRRADPPFPDVAASAASRRSSSSAADPRWQQDVVDVVACHKPAKASAFAQAPGL